MYKSAIILAASCLWLPILVQPNNLDPAWHAGRAEAPPILRHSPEFVVHFVDGKEMLLSSLRGKVVALVFVHTGCAICQHASQVFTKLYAEYGASGFEPIDVAFDAMASDRAPGFAAKYDIRYPVGFSSPEAVIEYLGIPAGVRYNIPLIVWIDANGDIRSATPAKTSEEMLKETYWRNMIESLLSERRMED